MLKQNVRAAGIWIENDQILLESLKEKEIWGIPGGGVGERETASEACCREYREELGFDMRCQSLAIIHEHLCAGDDRTVREHGFYFRVEPTGDTPPVPFEVQSLESQLKFRWFPLSELAQIEFVPDSVRQVLLRIGPNPIFVSERSVLTQASGLWFPGILSFSPTEAADAREVLSWRYPPPYDIYNAVRDQVDADIELLLHPENRYHIIKDTDGSLVAYCCFGPDGQVAAGDYHPDALDIGLGVRPDLTGRGLGDQFVAAVLDFAGQHFPAPRYRVTIAEFNRRALQVWEKAGFQPVQRFRRSQDGMLFLILARNS